MTRIRKVAAFLALLAGLGWHSAFAALPRSANDTVIEPPPPPPKMYAHMPRPDELAAMAGHLEREGTNAIPGDHRYILTITVGTPGTEGDVAYFFRSPFSGSTWMWILEEYRTMEKGLHVRFWNFYSDKVTTFDGYMPRSESLSATIFIVPNHSLWETAVGKSRRTWELLCGAYSCTLSFPP